MKMFQTFNLKIKYGSRVKEIGIKENIGLLIKFNLNNKRIIM